MQISVAPDFLVSSFIDKAAEGNRQLELAKKLSELENGHIWVLTMKYISTLVE